MGQKYDCLSQTVTKNFGLATNFSLGCDLRGSEQPIWLQALVVHGLSAFIYHSFNEAVAQDIYH
jgi:hypothetical protein